MFSIYKDGIVFAMTEKPNYIKLHPDGFYVLCDKDEAQGVAVNSVPYALTEGSLPDCEVVVVVETDGGSILHQTKVESVEGIAMVEEALCEVDTATDERLSAVEDALCELDTMLNGG